MTTCCILDEMMTTCCIMDEMMTTCCIMDEMMTTQTTALVVYNHNIVGFKNCHCSYIRKSICCCSTHKSS